MGKLAQFVREQPPKSFPSDTETNPKQCMVVTLRSGKELNESQNVEIVKTKCSRKFRMLKLK